MSCNHLSDCLRCASIIDDLEIERDNLLDLLEWAEADRDDWVKIAEEWAARAEEAEAGMRELNREMSRPIADRNYWRRLCAEAEQAEAGMRELNREERDNLLDRAEQAEAGMRELNREGRLSTYWKVRDYVFEFNPSSAGRSMRSPSGASDTSKLESNNKDMEAEVEYWGRQNLNKLGEEKC